jgi:hypothetical protein
MSRKYTQWYDGDWQFVSIGTAQDDGMDLACCHCGLVHSLNVKIIQEGRRRRVKIRLKQHARATAAVRRPFKFTKEED